MLNQMLESKRLAAKKAQGDNRSPIESLEENLFEDKQKSGVMDYQSDALQQQSKLRQSRSTRQAMNKRKS